MIRIYLIAFVLISVSVQAQPKWELLASGIPGSIKGIALTSYGTLFVASYFGGTFRSTDVGRTWDKMDVFPIEVFDIVSNSSNAVFVASPSIPNIYRSTNAGYTWEKTGDSTSWCYSLAVSQADVLYYGTSTSGVFRSVNHGDVWDPIGLTGHGGIWHLDVTSIGDIYASDGLSIFRSTNQGEIWEELTSHFPDYHILSISSSQSGSIYVGAHRSLDGNVFISTDRGETWTKRQFLNIDAKVIGVVEMSNDDLIAATDNASIWRSTDGGENWAGFWDGFYPQGATCIYQSRNGRVFVGANGAIYELMGYPVGTEELPAPSSLSLAQSYPNPVNPGQSAYINFSLPTQEYITLAVYNTAGQEVASIAQGTYQPGTHTARFNTSGLPTGVYVYRLIAGNRQESKLLQVVK